MTSLATTNGNQKKTIYLLCALAAFVIISWRIYDEFSSLILESIGASDWKENLKKLELGVAIVIPPLAGWMADRAHAKGKNFLMITIVMAITALIFLITGFINIDSIPAEIKSFVPYMMILWIIGMTVFFSPAINIIKHTAYALNLSAAVAAIIFIGDLSYALTDYINKGVAMLGLPLTFILAGLGLAALGFSYHRLTKNIHHKESEHSTLFTFQTIVSIIILGFVTGICKKIISSDTISNLSSYIWDIKGATFIFFFSAFGVLLISQKLKTEKLLNWYMAGVGLIVMAYLMSGYYVNSFVAFLQLALLIMGTTLVSYAVYPLAMAHVPSKHSNLGLGLLFSAFSSAVLLSKFF